jgi:hypothetical protein
MIPKTRILAFLAVTLAWAWSGCGGQESTQATGESSGTANARAEQPPKQHTTPKRSASTGPAQPGERPRRSEARERTLRTSSGAVVILPPRPSRRIAGSGDGCQALEVRRGDRTETFLRPPSPGLSAEDLGQSRLLVSYRFRGGVKRCPPAVLELTVDVNDDPLPGARLTARINGTEGDVTVTVPADLADADVVSATARTKDGIPSEAASVLIH